MSDWIEHDGKAAPALPAEAGVECRFRNGEEALVVSAGKFALSRLWIHSDRDPHNDIVAYRVVPHE